MKRLFIAEKPSVARAIASILGIKKQNKAYIECKNDTTVTWCFGHLYELAEPDFYTDKNAPKSSKTNKKIWRWQDLPIVPNIWQIIPKQEHKEHIDMLLGFIKKAECVVHAGDPDREGQLLVDEVIEKAGYTGQVLRYWANAIDDKSIKKALDNLESNSKYECLGYAATARQRCDWLVGMNVTRATTLLHRELYTVGRVQTPTLNLVYQRDQNIKNFKSTDFNVLKIEVNTNNGNYHATFQPSDTQQGIDEEGRLIDSVVAQDIADSCRNRDAKVISVTKTKKTINQPKGFSLAELTATASKILGFTAAQTLKIAQCLYEKKCTSYPRTDCCFLPNSQYEDRELVLDSISLICSRFKDIAQSVKTSTIKSKIWNDEKTTAHHAIIPTVTNEVVDLMPDEMELYELIAKRYIVQYMPSHEYEQTEVITKVENYNFKTIGKRILINGFKDFEKEEEDNNNKDQESSLPELNQGDIGTVKEVYIQKQKTQPPKYFTEGTLIAAMENIHRYIDNEEYKKLLKDGDGIGTSATRAGIIEELKKREFLKVEGKFIKSTAKGANLLANISDKVKSPILTANFESILTEIEENQKGINALLEKCIEFVSEEVASAKSKYKQISDKVSSINCPFCKDTKIIEHRNYYSCEKCNFSFNKEIAKSVPTEDYFKKVLSKEDVEYLTFTSKEGKSFKAKLELDSANKKLVFKFEPKEKTTSEISKFKYPKCGKALIRRESKNKKGLFWYGCSGYPKCELTFFEKDGKPDF